MSNRNLDDAVAEGDLVDQITPADPGDEDVAVAPLSAAASPVSESDWVDQQIPVPLDEDDGAPGAE